jgi:hypothetical protein
MPTWGHPFHPANDHVDEARLSRLNLLESLLEISIVSPVCLNREHFVTKADQHLLERIQSPDNQIGGQMVAA